MFGGEPKKSLVIGGGLVIYEIYFSDLLNFHLVIDPFCFSEGFIEFKATSEGQKVKPEPPDHYMTIDDDSQSSDAQSPKDCGSVYNVEMSPPPQPAQPMITDAVPVADVLRHATGADMLETAAAQAGIVTVVVAPNAGILATAPSPLSLGSSTSSLSPLSSIASPSSTVSHTSGVATFACSSPALTAATPRPSLPIHQQQPAPGKDKNRKKSKSKTQQQKTRTIKFHEYKVSICVHQSR